MSSRKVSYGITCVVFMAITWNCISYACFVRRNSARFSPEHDGSQSLPLCHRIVYSWRESKGIFMSHLSQVPMPKHGRMSTETYLVTEMSLRGAVHDIQT